MHISKGASIHMGCRLYHPWNISIGPHSVVNPSCILDGRAGLSIGRNVSISEQCIVLSLEHDPDSSSFESRGCKTTIEDDVWIGMRAIVLPGIRVGCGAVVGAGSVVTKDVAPFDVVCGNPARVIKQRSRDLSYQLQYRKLFY